MEPPDPARESIPNFATEREFCRSSDEDQHLTTHSGIEDIAPLAIQLLCMLFSAPTDTILKRPKVENTADENEYITGTPASEALLSLPMNCSCRVSRYAEKLT
jgi:hypothetical protein